MQFYARAIINGQKIHCHQFMLLHSAFNYSFMKLKYSSSLRREDRVTFLQAFLQLYFQKSYIHLDNDHEDLHFDHFKQSRSDQSSS